MLCFRCFIGRTFLANFDMRTQDFFSFFANFLWPNILSGTVILKCFLGTIPTKLLLQLSSVFRDGGLRDRSGIFCYKDHIHKGSTPVFAIAGDQDLICPPEAVYGISLLNTII